MSVIEQDHDGSFNKVLMRGERTYSFDAESKTLSIKNQTKEVKINNPSRKSTLKLLVAAGVDSQSSHEMLSSLGESLQWEDKSGLTKLIGKKELPTIENYETFQEFPYRTYESMYLRPSEKGMEMIILIKEYPNSEGIVHNSVFLLKPEDLLEFFIKDSVGEYHASKILSYYDSVFETNETSEMEDYSRQLMRG